MGKFCGKIGFAEEIETNKGVYQDRIIEKYYTGDILKNLNKMQNSGDVNDNINIDQRISIIGDMFAYENFPIMRYVEQYGTLWKVMSVEVLRPRLILTIGGVYNGPTPGTP